MTFSLRIFVADGDPETHESVGGQLHVALKGDLPWGCRDRARYLTRPLAAKRRPLMSTSSIRSRWVEIRREP